MSILTFLKDLFQNDEVDFTKGKEVSSDSKSKVRKLDPIVFDKKPIHKDKVVNKKKVLSQWQIVKMHLEIHGSLTSWEAIQLYRITRLSAIIFILKNEQGIDIDTIRMRTESENKSYAKYIILA